MNKLLLILTLSCIIHTLSANISELTVGETFDYHIEDFKTLRIGFEELTIHKDKQKTVKRDLPDRYVDIYLSVDVNFKVIETNDSSVIFEVRPNKFQYFSNQKVNKNIGTKISYNSEIQKPGPYVSVYYPNFTKEKFEIKVDYSEEGVQIEYFSASTEDIKKKSYLKNPAVIKSQEQIYFKLILGSIAHSETLPVEESGFKYRKDTLNNVFYLEKFDESRQIEDIYMFKKGEQLPLRITHQNNNQDSLAHIKENQIIRKIDRFANEFGTKYYPDNTTLREAVDTMIRKPNACLSGTLNTPGRAIPIQISGPAYLANSTQTYKVQSDMKGQYILQLDIDEPVEFYLDKKYKGILTPGDHLICNENEKGIFRAEGMDAENTVFYNNYLQQAIKFRVYQKPLIHFFDSTQYRITPSVWFKIYNNYRFLKVNIDCSKPRMSKRDTLPMVIDLDDDLLASSMFYTQEGIEKLDIWGIDQIQKLKENKGIQFNENDNGLEVYSYISLNYSGLTECLLKYYWVKHTWENELDHKKAAMILKLFLEEYPNSSYSKEIENFINTYDSVKKGTKAPEFQLQTINGEMVHLSDYKDQVVYLLFWSYDDPVRDFKLYAPILEEIKKKKDVEVLLVNCFKKKSEAAKNFQQITLSEFKNFNLKQESADYKRITSKLKIASLPRAVIIDKNGAIFNYHAPLFIFSKDLNEEIEEALKIPTSTKAFVQKAGMFIPLVVIVLLIVLLSYSARKSRKAKFNKRINEVKLKAIRSQMNPHFVFNALNSIQGLMNTNKKAEANLYLAKFATLLRNTLENSESPFITLDEELEAVRTYCELEKMRIDFVYEFNIDSSIKTSEIEISGMLIQPLIENAIVHGLAPKTDNRKLRLSIKQKKNYLIIIVADNGKGIQPDQTDKLKEKGFGLKLIEERLHLLEQEKKKAHLEILPYGIDKEQGTTVKLVFPIFS